MYVNNSYPKNIRILLGARMFKCYIYKDKVTFEDGLISPLIINKPPTREEIIIHIKTCRPLLKIQLT